MRYSSYFNLVVHSEQFSEYTSQRTVNPKGACKMLKVITCDHPEPCYHLLKQNGVSYYLTTFHSMRDILTRVKKLI